MSPIGAMPDGSHMYLYLPKEQEKVVKYGDCPSSFNLWYPDLMLMSERYLNSANLGNMLLRVGPL